MWVIGAFFLGGTLGALAMAVVAGGAVSDVVVEKDAEIARLRKAGMDVQA